MSTVLHWLSGATGGQMALAFGTGATGGYGFAIRTVLKAAKTQLSEMKLDHTRDRAEWRAEMDRERTDCDRRITKLEEKLSLLELERTIKGASVGDLRQAVQRKTSTKRVARRLADPDDDLIDKLKG